MTHSSRAPASAGEQILSQEEWYDLVVEASADGSWFWDINRGQFHCSPRLLEILECPDSQESLGPADFLRRVYSADRDVYKSTLAAHLKGETELFETEVRMTSAADRLRWVLMRGLARRDADGHAYCMLGSAIDITGRRQLEDALRTVASSTTEGGGPEFFESLVRYLAKALGSDIALVGSLREPDGQSIGTLAVYRDGTLQPNFEYSLAHTPCSNVVDRKTCAYPNHAASRFPGDALLTEERIAGYIGAPLLDSSDRAIGIIAVLFRHPVTSIATAEDLLKIFAARAAAELERLHKEQVLARSEKRYRELYHRTPVMLHSIDAEGRLVAVSDYWLKYLGYTEEQVVGHRTTEFLTEESRQRAVHEVLPRFFRTGRCHNVPYQLIRANGEVIDVLLSAVAEFDRQGKVDRSLAVMTDVTEQRSAEAGYSALFNNASEGIYRTSPEGRLLRANPALVEMHGFASEAELLESVTDIATQVYVDPEDREEILARLALEGRVSNFESRMFKRATGERMWVSENTRAVCGDNGEVMFYEGTVQDVTERRRLEVEYRDIFDNVGEGIYRSTPDGRMVRVNRALARLHGFDSPDQLIAAIDDLNSQWYVEPAARAELRRRVAEQGFVDGFEALVQCRNRRERIWTSETVRVTRGHDGEIQYYEGSVRDITIEYQSRQLARRRNAVLERIARDAPIGELLHDIVDIAETQFHDLSAAVFRLQDGRLYELAAPGLSRACLATLHGAQPSALGGALQAAVHGEDECAVTGPGDPEGTASPFRDMMRESGYACALAVPLRDQQGMVLAVLAAFSGRERSTCTAVGALLQELAPIASIAIEQDRLAAQLRHQARYDSLTGLPNRVWLFERLERVIGMADQAGHSVGVLLLDLDEFKLVNDSLGHGAGDQLLQEVAALLTGCVRADDTVTRLGGDEFVVVASLKRGARDCTDVAERLLQALQDHVHVAGRMVNARPSIGISVYPEDGQTPEVLLQAADTAMYVAKNTGKNRYHFFAKSMNQQVSERLQVESELQHAVRHERLELYYQPRVLFETDEVCGAEALLRWHHPQRGLLSAGAFIRIAERSPLMSDIDGIVLRQATERLAAWQARGMDLVLSVNVSARELHTDGFAAWVASTLEAADVDAQGLELEITESMLMRDYDRSRRQLEDLKERAPGLRIAIDDFGSGYSSLNHLRHLPIDTLKIDRTFVTDLCVGDGETAEAITKTIIELGRNLGMVVVAEGVETLPQAQWLKQHGCHQAQGYLFDRALSAAHFEHRLKSSPKS